MQREKANLWPETDSVLIYTLLPNRRDASLNLQKKGEKRGGCLDDN